VPLFGDSSRSSRRLSDDQSRALLAMRRGVPTFGSPREVLRNLAGQISAIVQAKVAFAGKRGDAWLLAAESAPDPVIPLHSGGDALDRIFAMPGTRVDLWRTADREWTLVAVASAPHPRVVMMLEGNWTSYVAVLADLAKGLAEGGRDSEEPAPRSLDATARQLTRALADTAGLAAVGEVVLQHIVRAVPSGMASLAVERSDGELSIIATHGYPLALVEHLSISSGSGVIGAVHASRTPMLVPDIRSTPGLDRRRSRYRTESFAVVPVLAGSESLGVLCLTDRLRPGPYTTNDLEALSVLLAPAALALGRERVWQEAQAYAQAAVIDPVSGLFNRRYFQARLDEELQRAIRQLTSVALLMVDLDGFKTINDRFGHIAGDLVIRDISEILRRSVRIFDVCTRFGGEEFAVMMPGGTLESAGAIAERIRHRVEGYQRSEPDLADLTVTPRIGVAVSPRGGTARDLIERADRALYHAKKAGKNRVSTASPDGSVWG